MANFTALAAARHAVLARVGWDVEAQGLFGAPPITVIVGAEAHVSLLKALAMLGLGRERVVTVPVDGQGRMRADALPALAGPDHRLPAGRQREHGRVRPCAAEHRPARRTRPAPGCTWTVRSGSGRARLPSAARSPPASTAADSWATDAHKWLNVPYDSGLALVRDEGALRAAMGVTAAYLPQGARRDPADFTPELSRRARGVEVWAALRALGRAGLAELVERCCRHARRFADGLRAAGHRVLNEVVLNQVLVSFGDADRTQRVIAALQADGTCWCGPTVWQGRPPCGSASRLGDHRRGRRAVARGDAAGGARGALMRVP